MLSLCSFDIVRIVLLFFTRRRSSTTSSHSLYRSGRLGQSQLLFDHAVQSPFAVFLLFEPLDFLLGRPYKALELLTLELFGIRVEIAVVVDKMVVRKRAIGIDSSLSFAFIVADMLNFDVLLQEEVRFTLVGEFFWRDVLDFFVVHLDVEVEPFHPDELVFHLALFGFLDHDLLSSLPSHGRLIHDVYEWLSVDGIDFRIDTYDDRVFLHDVVDVHVPLERLLDCHVRAVELVRKVLITFVIDPRLGREKYSRSPLVPRILQGGIDVLILRTPRILDFAGGLCQHFPFLDDAELFCHLPVQSQVRHVVFSQLLLARTELRVIPENTLHLRFLQEVLLDRVLQCLHHGSRPTLGPQPVQIKIEIGAPHVEIIRRLLPQLTWLHSQSRDEYLVSENIKHLLSRHGGRELVALRDILCVVMSFDDQAPNITLDLRNSGRMPLLPGRTFIPRITLGRLPRLLLIILALLHFVEDFAIFFEHPLVSSFVEVASRTYSSSHATDFLSLLELFGGTWEPAYVRIKFGILHQRAYSRRFEYAPGGEVVRIYTKCHTRVIFVQNRRQIGCDMSC